MATLVLRDAPVVTSRKVSLAYVIDRGEKNGTERITLTANVDPETPFLPVHKKDALNLCRVWDACKGYVSQVTSAANASYNADLRVWTDAVKGAVAAGHDAVLLRLMTNKPVKPDLPDAVAEQIAPFVQFMQVMRGAWIGAKKHTLSVFGTGKTKGAIIWTGTLSSLTRTSPTTGVIAKGRRVV